MELEEIIGKGRGRCVVVGCGVSAPTIRPYADKVFTIGVNDSCYVAPIDILLCLDRACKFEKTRSKFMLDSKIKAMVAPMAILDGYRFMDAGEFIPLDTSREKIDGFDVGGDYILGHLSVYQAILLAYMIGFTEIGMVGVDFRKNHFYREDGIYNQMLEFNTRNNAFVKLEKYLKDRGVSLYNLSKTSIVSVTKKDMSWFCEGDDLYSFDVDFGECRLSYEERKAIYGDVYTVVPTEVSNPMAFGNYYKKFLDRSGRRIVDFDSELTRRRQ